MFAVVRTGGKQYRVAAGDKIVVEKLAGEAGDTIQLGDVLLAGEGSDLKSTDGLTVSAEIIAQAKADKVIVFKKRRRHNYRRKNGHRQQHTILRITAIGDHKAEKPKKAKDAKPSTDAEAAPEAPAKSSPAAENASAPATPVAATPETQSAEPQAQAAEAPAKKPAAKKAAPKAEAPLKVEGKESEMVDTPAPKKKASTKKPAAGKSE
ncbi:50S ribosomal protein L21 [Sphingosinicella rhizophila]|uniref:Large ribosomal subunit protein bL21 n=1 Tax=Sphingosinicella rhizophila TaxID=3050082 RepID=A0ABU3Q5K4_9SPHN|nr:50S ribosomal protein L21 [Sphingosinicella sp. GR2756]MDT9598587.1 50S ribosomal protein L21 [Sphingosinicella sp. GR2756]